MNGRRGIIRLTDRDLLTLLGLPLGYEIVGVYANYQLFSIDVIVVDDSLKVVEPGAEPPLLPGKLTRDRKGILSWESMPT